MNLEEIKGVFPHAKGTGDVNQIESILSEGIGCFHIDSHDTKDGFRFQGVFYFKIPDSIRGVVLDDCPINVLHKAKEFRIINNRNHFVWTIWFTKPVEDE